MTKQEVQNLVGWAVANFPSMQERDLRPTCELWFKGLNDIPYDIAEKALIKVLSTSKFFPTLAEIREAAVQLTTPYVPGHAEAWGEVNRAIRNYGYYREEEALNSMSPKTAEVVKFIGWKEICTSEEPDVIRGQFRRAYESQTQRAREVAVLPESIKDILQSLNKPKTKLKLIK